MGRYVVEREWLCDGLFGRKYCQELGLAIYECYVYCRDHVG